MKYGFLLKALRALIYIKRFFWWLGTGFYFVLAKIFSGIWRFGAWLNYKFKYFLDKSGLNKTVDWLLRRERTLRGAGSRRGGRGGRERTCRLGGADSSGARPAMPWTRLERGGLHSE